MISSSSLFSTTFRRSFVNFPKGGKFLINTPKRYSSDSESSVVNEADKQEMIDKFNPPRGYEDQFYRRFYYLTKQDVPPKSNLGDLVNKIAGEHKGSQKDAELDEQLLNDKDFDFLNLSDDSDIANEIKKFNEDYSGENYGENDATFNYNVDGFINLQFLKEKYLPEGYPGRIDEFEFTWITIEETLCRKCAADLMSKIDSQKENGFLKSKGTKPIILDGPNGVGKSIALCHTVLHARSNGWLVLYVPHLSRLLKNYRIKPSQTRKWIYDVHEAALAILKDFKAAHEDKLSKIKMRTSLPNIDELKAFNDAKTKDTTLLDLIDFGLTCDNPSEVFVALRTELNSVTEFPVLIAVDDLNGLMGKTGFMKPIHLTSLKVEWVMGHDVSILLALNRPEETSLVNGTYISALTTQKPIKPFHKEVRKEFFEDTKVEIPSYSFSEYQKRVAQYLESGDIFTEPSKLTEEYIFKVTSGRPKHVANYFSTITSLDS